MWLGEITSLLFSEAKKKREKKSLTCECFACLFDFAPCCRAHFVHHALLTLTLGTGSGLALTAPPWIAVELELGLAKIHIVFIFAAC